ncbi:PTS sugar transporter subunit IIA [candidate division WOR-3 bacterium]|nr:PTS sugar transporter subunit IIA [candidate division WOR-3 bacterium]
MLQIPESNIILNLKGTDKASIARELLETMQQIGDIENILEAILARNKIMSQAPGRGVAILRYLGTYARTTGLAVGIKREGIDFDALDGRPVYIFFLLVSNDRSKYVDTLAGLLRLIQQPTVRLNLLRARSEGQIKKILETQPI